MNTCGGCHFYEGGLTITKADGDSGPGGFCYGAPPTSIERKIKASDGTDAYQSRTAYPSVRSDQRECALWRAPPPPPKPRSRK